MIIIFYLFLYNLIIDILSIN